MIRLNFKVALRNLWKNKDYTLINILGLSIGMMSCMVIFLFIWYQWSYDKGFKNENRIYRFVTNWKYNNSETYSQGVPVPLVAAARNEIPGIEKIGVIMKKGATLSIKDESGKNLIKSEESVFYVEPDFFEIINITWIFGKAKSALSEPNSVALSERMAIRFFGTPDNAIGKSISGGAQMILKVTGVFKDLPDNSSFPLNVLISYKTFNSRKFVNWDAVSSQWECYVLLKQGMKVKDLDVALAMFNKRHYGNNKIAGNQSNSLQALNDIHFSERYGNFANTSASKKQMYGLGLVGLFLMLTACINFINLATAQAINRAKEVGIRKVMGGTRNQLVLQFLTETFAITLFALLLACVSTELMLPTMQDLFRNHISLDLFGDPVIFFFLGALVIIVCFVAGFYPALILSGYHPVQALKNKASLGNTGFNLRKVLVVGQFALTGVLLTSTLVIFKQMKYIQDKSLGFSADAVSMINVPRDSISKSKLNGFKLKALQIPGVEMFSFCSIPPLSEDISPTSFSYAGKEINDFEIRVNVADENYLKLFSLKMHTAKPFTSNETPLNCVVNETFLKRMNITDPSLAIGKILTVYQNNLKITGVVKDFNDKTLKEVISPMVIYSDRKEYFKAAIKIDPKHLTNSMKKVEALWNLTFPDDVFKSSFVNDDIQSYYENDRTTGVLLRVFSGVVIFISFIGLFGLTSFVAAQRTKEVAIRKVLGASVLELMQMLNWSFIRLVLFANLIAWPIAYFFISIWLSEFAFRIDLSVLPFVTAMVLSLIVAFFTVSLRSYRAAVINTVESLKYD